MLILSIKCQTRHFLNYFRLLRYTKKDIPTTKFVIVGQGRTGSQLMVSLLNNHPDIYCDSEIFHPDYFGKVIFPKAYINSRALLATDQNKKVYGFKVKHYQLRDDQGISPQYLFNYLNENGWKFIYLDRTNLLRHSLSNFKANESGEYHINKRKGYKKLRIDPNELISYMIGKEQFKKEELSSLAGIKYLNINYEKDLASFESQQKIMDKVFNYLGLDSVKVISNYKKTSLSKLEDMIENYDEIKNVLLRTKYSNFLDD